MNDELKTQITALRTAIMRRVEYEQCIHASSIEDEIGKFFCEWMSYRIDTDGWVASPYSHTMIADAIRRARDEMPTIPTPPEVTRAISDAMRQQDQQRRAQALAQQKLYQPIADNGFSSLVLKADAVAPGLQKRETKLVGGRMCTFVPLSAIMRMQTKFVGVGTDEFGAWYLDGDGTTYRIAE